MTSVLSLFYFLLMMMMMTTTARLFSLDIFFSTFLSAPSLLSLLWTYACAHARTSFGDTCCCGLQRKKTNVESEQLKESFFHSIESYSCGGDRPWWVFLFFRHCLRAMRNLTIEQQWISTLSILATNDQKEAVLSLGVPVRWCHSDSSQD